MEAIWKQLFAGLLADDSIATTRGKLQIQLLKRKKEAEQKGAEALDAFYASLLAEFPQYFEGGVNEAKEETGSVVSNVSSASSEKAPVAKREPGYLQHTLASASKASPVVASSVKRMPSASASLAKPKPLPASRPMPVASAPSPASASLAKPKPLPALRPMPVASAPSPASTSLAKPKPLTKPLSVAPAPSIRRLFQQPAGSEPVISAKTLTTGDCFYSSIWRSAGEQGVRNQILDCFGIPRGVEERDFIQRVRNMLAARARNNDLLRTFDPASQQNKNAYNGLREKSDEGLYELSIELFPDWFKQKFASLPPSKSDFLEQFAQEVSTMTRWVSQIEVEMVEELLERCGILLEKHNHDIPYAFRTKRGLPVLNLHNKGEAHWEYFSFQVPAGYTDSKAFKAKLEREQKIVEEGIATRERSEQLVLERLRKEAEARGAGGSKGGGKRKTRKLKTKK